MKNQKIEVIRRRERRNDIIFGVIALPMVYFLVCAMAILGV
jgi:hypothetical protein